MNNHTNEYNNHQSSPLVKIWRRNIAWNAVPGSTQGPLKTQALLRLGNIAEVLVPSCPLKTLTLACRTIASPLSFLVLTPILPEILQKAKGTPVETLVGKCNSTETPYPNEKGGQDSYRKMMKLENMFSHHIPTSKAFSFRVSVR